MRQGCLSFRGGGLVLNEVQRLIKVTGSRQKCGFSEYLDAGAVYGWCSPTDFRPPLMGQIGNPGRCPSDCGPF